MRQCAGQDDLPDRRREILLHHRLLRQIADLIWLQTVSRLNAARQLVLQSQQCLDQRTLARTVLSNYTQIISCMDLKIQICHDWASVIAKRQISTCHICHRLIRPFL